MTSSGCSAKARCGEVILATNPTVEGEATAHYLGRARVAHGAQGVAHRPWRAGRRGARVRRRRHAGSRSGGPHHASPERRPGRSLHERQFFVEAAEPCDSFRSGALRCACSATAPRTAQPGSSMWRQSLKRQSTAEFMDLDEAALGGPHDARGRREIAHARAHRRSPSLLPLPNGTGERSSSCAGPPRRA